MLSDCVGYCQAVFDVVRQCSVVSRPMRCSKLIVNYFKISSLYSINNDGTDKHPFLFMRSYASIRL